MQNQLLMNNQTNTVIQDVAHLTITRAGRFLCQLSSDIQILIYLYCSSYLVVIASVLGHLSSD